MATVKIGLKDISTAKLISKTDFLLAHIKDNTDFPNPVPSVAFLEEKLAEVKKWNLPRADRSSTSVMHRNRAEDELKDAIKRLGNYISIHAQGDALKITRSGFALRRKPRRVREVLAPQGLSAAYGRLSGEIDLKWRPDRPGIMFIVEMAEILPDHDASEWVIKGYTKKSKFTLAELTPGNRYQFRLKAVGSDKQSGYSQVVYSMAVW